MTEILYSLYARAKANPRRVIFPEVNDPRVQEAIASISEQKLCVPVVLRRPEQGRLAIDCKVLAESPNAADIMLQATEAYRLSRVGKKGGDISLDEASEALKNPLLLAAVLERINFVDAGIAGSIATTGDVLRACLRGIGLAADCSLLSSVFLLSWQARVFTVGDCAVNPAPNSEQLAQIALDAAEMHYRLVDEQPRVAMLSFSTLGSAEHENVSKVREAVAIVRGRNPELAIEGEIQFDAAFVPDIAAKKAPDSTVAGQANVFIFPDLQSANIGYKIAERMGGAQAVGPILQGLDKPFLDLSRGCSAQDIVDCAVIASVLSA